MINSGWGIIENDFLFPHLHSVDINKMVETFKKGVFDH